MSYSAFTPRYLPSFPNKDPADSLNYGIDFSEVMAADGDTLASVVNVICTPPGLTITDVVAVGSIATFRLAGGVSNTRYLVDAQIQTAAGNFYNRGGTLLVVPR